MDNTKALILGAAIALGGVALYMAMDEPSPAEEAGEAFDEGVEEIGDEFDDATN